jgi:ABC-2 type transport system permease protein
MASTESLREISRRPGPLQRVRDVWTFRELLRNLIRKELKVKYKSSVLGFFWTLLNPALYLVVFSIVFKYILDSAVPDFAIFLLSGLLAWNLFSAAVSGGTGSIVGNASLVQKVWFPREILPLAAIGAAVCHFFFQFFVLVGALVVLQHSPDWGGLWLIPPALVILIVLAAGIAIALAAINVYLRDTEHLLELALLAWFWLSAIVYPYMQVANQLGDKANLLLLNPIVPVVLVFQRVIYNPPDSAEILPADTGLDWYARNLAIIGVGSVIFLVVALHIFGRLEDNLAEEI